MAKYDPIIIRIDDRLIHGQVLVGWASHYPIKHFIVGNDDIVQNEWERNLLLMAASPEFDTRVLSIPDTLEYIHQHLESEEVSMVLISSVPDLQLMDQLGLRYRKINIGGVHFTEGRKKYLPYLYLDEEEKSILKELIARGYDFYCQDVPGGGRYDLAKVLEKK